MLNTNQLVKSILNQIVNDYYNLTYEVNSNPDIIEDLLNNTVPNSISVIMNTSKFSIELEVVGHSVHKFTQDNTLKLMSFIKSLDIKDNESINLVLNDELIFSTEVK